jgi:hypothetical protein
MAQSVAAKPYAPKVRAAREAPAEVIHINFMDGMPYFLIAEDVNHLATPYKQVRRAIPRSKGCQYVSSHIAEFAVGHLDNRQLDSSVVLYLRGRPQHSQCVLERDGVVFRHGYYSP